MKPGTDSGMASRFALTPTFGNRFLLRIGKGTLSASMTIPEGHGFLERVMKALDGRLRSQRSSLVRVEGVRQGSNVALEVTSLKGSTLLLKAEGSLMPTADELHPTTGRADL